MAKPDIVRQINETKNRGKPLGGSFIVFRLMLTLHSLKDENLARWPLEYYPVAAIASLEVYFRHQIKQVIDSGDPYIERAGELTKNAKLGYDILKGLLGRDITIGDVIAHVLSFNGIHSIEVPMCTLLSANFREAISTPSSRASITPLGMEPITKESCDRFYRGVQECFRVRHIICHELPSENPVSLDSVRFMISGVFEFLQAFEVLIENFVHPNEPLTQREMNEQSKAILHEVNGEIDDLMSKIVPKWTDHTPGEFEKVQVSAQPGASTGCPDRVIRTA